MESQYKMKFDYFMFYRKSRHSMYQGFYSHSHLIIAIVNNKSIGKMRSSEYIIKSEVLIRPGQYLECYLYAL